jgi:hypothetical protein
VEAELPLEPRGQLEAAGGLLDQPAQLPEARLLLARLGAERAGVDDVLALGQDPEAQPAHQLARRTAGVGAGARHEQVDDREGGVEREVWGVSARAHLLGPDLARNVDQQTAAVALAVDVAGPVEHLLERGERGLDRLVRWSCVLGDPGIEGAGVAVLDGARGPPRAVGPRRVISVQTGLLGSAASPSGRATGRDRGF